MKYAFIILILTCISVFYMNCDVNARENDTDIASENSSSAYTININFEHGENLSSSAWKNIYVIWIEDSTAQFIQNLYICKKLITGGLTGTALPYWKTQKYPTSSKSEIDAVTGATIANANFSVSAILKDSTIRKFTIYFEIDRSYEPNDWFADQPALLYTANINLDEINTDYELLPLGWTPNENTQNQVPNTPMGLLKKEMKYITNFKDGSLFGTADARASTKMVKRITANVRKPATVGHITKTTDDFNITIYPNPTNEQVNITSREIMSEIIITNANGQTILNILPKTFETSFIINKAITPLGTYFATIKTSKGLFTHKLLITK